MSKIDLYRLKSVLLPHGLIYIFLSFIIICLTILTIIHASAHRIQQIDSTADLFKSQIIGYPPQFPNRQNYIQWTFLHLNDVYELLPLDQGRKGGLARVAYVRKLLKEENSHTYTILAGDLLSPSALGQSKVNGTILYGRQMISTMNTLGLDYMTFGNHEFDISEMQLLSRMNESKFTWISSNVFQKTNNQSFGSSITHKILTIDSVRILLIGLTIDGNDPYIRIIEQTHLVDYVREFLNRIPHETYDVLVALTHLDMSTDIQLVNRIPQIDLIMGGHEHENYYYQRGRNFTTIAKADANAATIYIHRCAFNSQTRQFRVYSTLTRITADIPDEEQTHQIAHYWYDQGIEGFRTLGFEPEKVVSCLPDEIELDGRSESVRNHDTLLTNLICESIVNFTSYNQTTIGLLNGGSVRIDDILRETITQYDILRTLPFENIVVSLAVPGELLAQFLTKSLSLKGNGMFITYTGIETSDNGNSWFINGIDIATSEQYYHVATTEYVRDNTLLNNSDVIQLSNTRQTQTKIFMNYLTKIYPPC